MRYNIKQEIIDIGAGGDCGFPQTKSLDYPSPQNVVIENDLPQFAIKKKSSNHADTEDDELVLLNGNWDTSNTIPNIVAEMHNVKLEELQSTWVREPEEFFVDSHDPLNLKCENFIMSNASPRGSDSGLGSDSPEGNLSWLLNFKLDEIPGLPDCPSQANKRYTPRKTYENQKNVSPVYIAETIPKQYFDQHRVQNVNVARIIQEQSTASKEENATSVKPVTNNNNPNATRFTPIRKPPFTYTELIEHALREKGELTVSGIYQWISDHFSFYKANDDRWKNSVRHNLSINPHFRKGSKAVHGAGHLWTIAQKDDFRNSSSWNAKKQRMQQFMQNAANEWQQQQQQEIELAVATASILPDGESFENNVQIVDSQNQAQIHQTATEILGGMKREVEVQYIIPVSNTMDFMCPVSKEQVAEECGLGGEEIQVTENDYLITDLNPNTLGLNLSEAEIITTDQLFSDDLNFQCFEVQTEQ